jgi:hypothetical protein
VALAMLMRRYEFTIDLSAPEVRWCGAKGSQNSCTQPWHFRSNRSFCTTHFVRLLTEVAQDGRR